MPKPRVRYLFDVPGSAAAAFVPHPTEIGRWLRLDPSAVLVACPAPECGAGVGEPCRNYRQIDGERLCFWMACSTHWQRRREARGKRPEDGGNVLVIRRSR